LFRYSLWGALRHNKPLAWDNDFDIGLIYSELKSSGKEKALYKELKRKNIKIYYRYWFGTYRVTRDTARGDLMVYQRSWFDNCVRLGTESWVFFMNYQKYHYSATTAFRIEEANQLEYKHIILYIILGSICALVLMIIHFIIQVTNKYKKKIVLLIMI